MYFKMADLRYCSETFILASGFCTFYSIVGGRYLRGGFSLVCYPWGFEIQNMSRMLLCCILR